MATPSGGVYFIECETMRHLDGPEMSLGEWTGAIIDRAAIIMAQDCREPVMGDPACRVFLRDGAYSPILVRGSSKELRAKLLPPARDPGSSRGRARGPAPDPTAF